jgi:type I restriction enzyme S subunit
MKKDWKVEKLGDICRIEMGKTPSRGNRKYWDTEKATNNIWLSIADLNNAEEKVIYDSKEYISDEGAKLCKVVKQGTLLVSFKLTLGRLAFAGIDLFTNEAIAALSIIDEKKLSKDFLYWYLSFFDWDSATGGDVKVKGKTLNKEKLKAIPVPLPPLPEQQRIVALLDETLSALDTVHAHAERNQVNAREVYKAVLAESYENAGNDWQEKKLGDIASEMQTGPFGSTLHKSDYVPNGIPVVNPQNMVDGEIVPLAKMMINQKTRERLNRYILKENDIVLARRGEMGRCAIVKKQQEGWLCGSGSFILRVGKEVDPNYLVRYLSSDKVKRTLQKGSVGATMDNLNQEILSQVDIPFPPFSEQRAIVKRLDALAKETKRLEEIYEQKSAAVEELKKSILKRELSIDNSQLIIDNYHEK